MTAGAAGPRAWRLHLGTHKTATTHLQAVLEALRPELEAQGTGLATIEQTRPARALDLRRRRAPVWGGRIGLGRARLGREIEARLGARVALHPRMVLSEEGMLGDAQAPLGVPIYPQAHRRLRALVGALPGIQGLWLSLRRLDGFLPAAYATALKHGSPRVDAVSLRARALADPPDWAAFVARLQGVAPGVPVTVWDYADYRAGALAVASDLAGIPLAGLPEMPDPAETRTPDADAIRAAEALPRGMDPVARAAHVGEIYAAATGPRFALFSEEEAARLGDLHRRQMDALEAMPGVRRLRP